MKRRDFILQMARLAACAPMVSLLGGCADASGGLDADFPSFRGLEVGFDGSVLIIGAGSSGLAAGYLLSRYGIEYEVLEAKDRFGGRIGQLDGFMDFPIDIGAEWLHADASMLAQIVDDPTSTGSVEMVPFSPQSIQDWDGSTRRSFNFGRNYYQEYKFKRSTWWSFLDEFIAPQVKPRIRYQQPVSVIDTSGERVVVTAEDGTTYEADHVIITVPVKILQEGLITFVPALGAEQVDVLDSIHVPPGIKVFTEFSRRFYPDILNIGSFVGGGTDKLYFNGAFKKGSSRHLMTLFWVEDAAAEYTDLPDDQAIIAAMMEELDQIFDGDPSRYFVKSAVKNWSADPYIRGAYHFGSSYGEAEAAAIMSAADPRLHFAGEAFSTYTTSTVHGAMEAGYREAAIIIEG